MKNWWKFLAAFLVFYSLVVGMLVPLSNGIISGKSEMTLVSGKNQSLNIQFYNSCYKKDKIAEKTFR